MDSLLAAFHGLFIAQQQQQPLSSPVSGSSVSASSVVVAAAATAQQHAQHAQHAHYAAHYTYNTTHHNANTSVIDPEVLRSIRRIDINKRNQLWHVHCALAPNKVTMEYIVNFLRLHPHVISQLILISFYMLQHDGSITVLKDYLTETKTLTSFHIQSNGINPMCAGHLLSAFYYNTSITKLVLSHVGFHGGAAGGACLHQLLEKSIHLQQLELAFVHLGLHGIRGLAAGLLASSSKRKNHDSSSSSSLTHLVIRNCIFGGGGGGGNDDDDEGGVQSSSSLDVLVDAIIVVTNTIGTTTRRPRRCLDGGSGGLLESLHLADNDMITTRTVSSTTARSGDTNTSNRFVSAVIRLLELSRLKSLILGEQECLLLFHHHHHHHQHPHQSIANVHLLTRTLMHNSYLQVLDLSACHDLIPDDICAMILYTMEFNVTLQELILGSNNNNQLVVANDENNNNNNNNNNIINNNALLVRHCHRYPLSHSQLITSLPKIKGLRRLQLPWNVFSSSSTLSSNNTSTTTVPATTTTTTKAQDNETNNITIMAALYRNTSLEHFLHYDFNYQDSVDNAMDNNVAVANILKRNRQLNHLKSLFVLHQQQQQHQPSQPLASSSRGGGGGGGISSSSISSTSSIMNSSTSPSITTIMNIISPGLWLKANVKLASWQNATAIYKVIRQATFHDGSLVVLHSNYYHHHHGHHS